MNRIYRKKPFWSLFGPILIFFGIEMAAQFLAWWMVLIFNQDFLKLLMEGMLSAQQIDFEEINNQALQIFSKYQVGVMGVTAFCTLPLTVLLFRKDRKLEKTYQVPVNKKASGKKYPQLAVLGLAFSVGFTCLAAMLEVVFYSEQYEQAQVISYTASLPVQLICLGLIIPLAEEMMFRGVLFKRFREYTGFKKAAVYSSFCFCLIHGNIIQMLYGFVTGMFLAYVCEKYGSMIAPAFLHIVMNLCSLILTEVGVFNWMAMAPIRMGAAVVVSACLISVVFVCIQRIEEKPEQPGNSGSDKITPDMFR